MLRIREGYRASPPSILTPGEHRARVQWWMQLEFPPLILEPHIPFFLS
jgi:hypothetical protein